MAELKYCKCCNKLLPKSEFHKCFTNKDGLSVSCKSCRKIQNAKRYKQNKEYWKAYNGRNKSNRLVNEYGIDYEEYRKIIKLQNNKCKICGCELESERKSFIDHNHETGEIRGVLCPSCNTAIGLLQDNTNILAQAMLYVETNGELNHGGVIEVKVARIETTR